MYRREFIVHSGIVLGVAVVGLPSLTEAFAPDVTEPPTTDRPRLVGHRRSGCARPKYDPLIALQLPPDFPVHFA